MSSHTAIQEMVMTNCLNPDAQRQGWVEETSKRRAKPGSYSSRCIRRRLLFHCHRTLRSVRSGHRHMCRNRSIARMRFRHTCMHTPRDSTCRNRPRQRRCCHHTARQQFGHRCRRPRSRSRRCQGGSCYSPDHRHKTICTARIS